MAAPLMTGAEYLTGTMLRALWRQTDQALRLELSEQQCGVQEYLKGRNPAWNLVGRVCFNLAENRSDAESPFAFLASHRWLPLKLCSPPKRPLEEAGGILLSRLTSWVILSSPVD